MMLAEIIQTETVYRLGRAASLDGWWAWALLVAAASLLLWFSVWMVRRDAVELNRPLRLALLLLRITAITCLLVFFLAPERRSQQRQQLPSEVAVVVDASQSMTLPAAGGQKETRIDEATGLVAQSPLVKELSQSHNVTLYTTTAAGPPQAAFASNRLETEQDRTGSREDAPNVRVLTILARIGFAAVLLALGLLLAAGLNSFTGNSLRSSRLIFASVVLLVGGGIVLATSATVAAPHSPGRLLAGIRTSGAPAAAAPEREDVDEVEVEDVAPVADAASTRLGDAVVEILQQHDPQTMAGIVLLTDGQNNAGVSLEDAARRAAVAGVPLFPVGLGSSRPAPTVRWVDLEVPPRVYPGDRFQVVATLQAAGITTGEVTLELRDAAEGAGGNGSSEGPDAGELLEVKQIPLEQGGERDEEGLLTARFELAPAGPGQRRLSVRIVGDDNWRIQSPVRSARYEVVTRRTKVLLIAGGPTREFRFVRNLLHRDDDVTLDLVLQSGQEGISQEANQVLDQVPTTATELFEYDAVIAFDPDWSKISAETAELLARWVADQAGGMVFIAGPVNMPLWTRSRGDASTDTLRSLLPVRLGAGSLLLDDARFENRESWPLEFTPDGMNAGFLQPSDDAVESAEVWQNFGGVYGYYATAGPKPGATVYARFSDPTTKTDEGLPVFFASQFYGGGRVFFMGSGELWRLRAAGDQYFDAIYTKLVRWVSEGRLLRDSNRGILLVDRNRAMVGDTITIRAILTDAQFQPLAVPSVDASILGPEGSVVPLQLNRLEGQPREGTYGATWVPRRDGNYEIQIELTDGVDVETLSRTVQVRLPTLELERPRRNDAALESAAEITDGRYLVAVADSAGSTGSIDWQDVHQKISRQLVGWLEPRSLTVVLPGTPDREFQLFRNAALMVLIAGALLLEWFLRRLHRLA